MTFPFIGNNVTEAHAYEVYTSKLIRNVRGFGSYQEFLYRVLLLTRKIQNQYLYHKCLQLCSVCDIPVFSGATSGAGTAYGPGAPELIPGFNGFRVVQYLVFCVVFCRSLCVLFLFDIALSIIFDLRFLITHLVSSNFSEILTSKNKVQYETFLAC